jgi:hypothetical protein
MCFFKASDHPTTSWYFQNLILSHNVIIQQYYRLIISLKTIGDLTEKDCVLYILICVAILNGEMKSVWVEIIDIIFAMVMIIFLFLFAIQNHRDECIVLVLGILTLVIEIAFLG